MSKTIKPGDLGKAIEETLTIYGKSVIEAVNEAGREAVKKLVKLTKATAPVGKRAKHYKASITSEEVDTGHGDKRFTWGAKGKEARLTHLLVHGHATKDGGRTKANPFLQNALDVVLPEYEKKVEEAVKNAK